MEKFDEISNKLADICIFCITVFEPALQSSLFSRGYVHDDSNFAPPVVAIKAKRIDSKPMMTYRLRADKRQHCRRLAGSV